jgi:hypothetical protein
MTTTSGTCRLEREILDIEYMSNLFRT